jgi:hypothetical protein
MSSIETAAGHVELTGPGDDLRTLWNELELTFGTRDTRTIVAQLRELRGVAVPGARILQARTSPRHAAVPATTGRGRMFR